MDSLQNIEHTTCQTIPHQPGQAVGLGHILQAFSYSSLQYGGGGNVWCRRWSKGGGRSNQGFKVIKMIHRPQFLYVLLMHGDNQKSMKYKDDFQTQVITLNCPRDGHRHGTFQFISCNMPNFSQPGQAVQYKYRLYKAKRDCTANEIQ